MRKILMMAVLAFLSLQGVGARASGISLLESGKKKLVAQEDTVKKDTVKKVTAYEKLLKDGGSECEGMFTVRHIKDNWYFEVPDTLLGRLLLAVTRFKEHSAHSRKGFALGAVLAAEFTANHSGLLTR